MDGQMDEAKSPLQYCACALKRNIQQYGGYGEQYVNHKTRTTVTDL